LVAVAALTVCQVYAASKADKSEAESLNIVIYEVYPPEVTNVSPIALA
jgi:hypothetical protein